MSSPVNMSDRNTKSPLKGLGVSVAISNLNLKYQQKLVLKDLDWTIAKGENWLLSGESGSGKTALAKIIANDNADVTIIFDLQSNLPAQILYVESWYHFKNIEGVANFYYQQRYTSLQTKDIITVQGELQSYGIENNLDFSEAEDILEIFDFEKLKSSTLIELSSGEHKKLQLIKALWLKPQLLIIDQPYTGLDSASRKRLNNLIDDVAYKGVQFILIGNDVELPTCINQFAVIENKQLKTANQTFHLSALPKRELKPLPEFLQKPPAYSSDKLVKMVDVNISYGDKKVLKNINWEVNAGEKWLLQGHNGSGKSTLLSLINGDHPQSYANELYLFGNKRGSGESIWDIKQHIGLISPEFHWYFDSTSTVWQSIASGFYDTVGLFQQIPYSKSKQVDELIAFFELEEYKNDLLSTLPIGKQRVVLLARTIIKNPELLILDEPCQGMDEHQTEHFNLLLDELSSHGMTMIYVGHFEAQIPTCIEKRIVLENGKIKTNEILKELRLAY